MDTQQEHIYNERIQEFFPLLDKRKKEDDSIYNARVDFNAVKFFIKHPDWDWNKDKVSEVVFQECDNAKKAEQKFENEVKARLKEYVDDVAGVSIYGNHASITLGDGKKEFKISEFLNSDFCQKKGISGFSTLHSDGKSGMHGFVAEEGGKKIRHYVVTDGSYEMTLKWYAEGKECEIKIKIDANGVELVKGDDFSLERLEANRDVKIGGLFLHEIEFREKGQGKANEMKESSETFIESNSRDIEQEVKKPVQMNLKDQEENSVIGGLFSHLPQQEVGFQSTISRYNSENGLGDKSQKEDSQKKRTPPPLPPRTTPKENVVNEQGGSKLESQKSDKSEQTPNNQQKGATTVSRPDSRDNYDFPTSDPSDSSAFTKSVSHNQDNRQEDERYDNPTFATFGHAVPGSQKPDRSEQTPNDQQQPKIQQQEGNSKGDLLQDIRNFKKNNLRHIDVDDRKASIAGSRKNNPSPLETLKDRIPYSSSSDNSDNQDDSDAKWKESEQPLSATALNNKSDSCYSSPTHANHEQSQVNPGQLKASLMNVEQRDNTLLTEFTSKLDKETQKFPLKPVDQKGISEQTKEHLLAAGLLKDSSTDVKTVAERENAYTSPTVDKNSELYKLLEKDKIQLEVGIIEEERKDTLTEHTDSYDRNRIVLGNRNKRPLDWTKRIAESQQEKDIKKGISI